MSGIYILKTTDGYRVSFSTRYTELVSLSPDAEYMVNGNVAKSIFENCYCYQDLDKAYEHAHIISKFHEETEDGIFLVTYAEKFSYGEVKNGKNY
jgi:hypothetical protein